MTDGEALLAAILANPDDDAPRLIFCDWLEEHGEDERARFIREGIASGAKWEQPLWNGGLPGENYTTTIEMTGFNFVLPCPVCSVCYHRGFISTITLTAANWITYADEIKALHPVQQVTLTTWPDLRRSDDRNSYGVRTMFTVKEIIAAESQDDDARFNWTLPILRLEWPGITFSIADNAQFVDTVLFHGTGENLPMGTINVEEESDAAPERRESAAQRAREIEFTGRHRRRR